MPLKAGCRLEDFDAWGGGGDLLKQTPVTSCSFPRGNLDMADVEICLELSLYKSWCCGLEWMGYVYQLKGGLDKPGYNVGTYCTRRVEVVSRPNFENLELKLRIQATQSAV